MFFFLSLSVRTCPWVKWYNINSSLSYQSDLNCSLMHRPHSKAHAWLLPYFKVVLNYSDKFMIKFQIWSSTPTSCWRKSVLRWCVCTKLILLEIVKLLYLWAKDFSYLHALVILSAVSIVVVVVMPLAYFCANWWQNHWQTFFSSPFFRVFLPQILGCTHDWNS